MSSILNRAYLSLAPACLLALACLSMDSPPARADDTVSITIAHDNTDDILVTVYDMNTNPHAKVLDGQRISGFASVPTSVTAGAGGTGHVYWRGTRTVIPCTSPRIRSAPPIAESRGLAPGNAVPAIDEQTVSRNADREQGKRGRNHLDNLVHAQPVHRCVQPVHEGGEPACIAILHAALEQPNPQAVIHAHMRPLALTEPPIGLQPDQSQERKQTAVADHGADGADQPQGRVAGFHGADPAAGGQAFTSRRTMRPDSPCRSAGFNRLSVGFKSMSIQ